MNDYPNQFAKTGSNGLRLGMLSNRYICAGVFTLSNTYSERQLLASEDPDARNAAVVVAAKQEDTAEGILSEFVQALEHAC